MRHEVFGEDDIIVWWELPWATQFMSKPKRITSEEMGKWVGSQHDIGEKGKQPMSQVLLE